MNSIGGEVIAAGVNKAIEIAEKDYRGLVIGNEGQNFSAGAKHRHDLRAGYRARLGRDRHGRSCFQNMNMRVRYSSVPVVVAPHALRWAEVVR